MLPRAEPAVPPSARPGTLWRALPGTITVVGVAVVMRLVYTPWYLNYDARYALLWARDLWHGARPDVLAPYAPTPHPLETALSSLALPFGDHAATVVVWGTLLCFGILVWLTYLLGTRLFGAWAGVIAALAVVTRPVLESQAVVSYQDIGFAALVVGAVLAEVRRPRRGAPVLALLALAGLMRPDAWVLAGLYWLYLWPRRSWGERAGLAALVAVAPGLWALFDLAVAGNALHSLHGTAHLATRLGRHTRFAQVPSQMASDYHRILLWPLIGGIPVGVAFAWRRRLGRGAVPLAAAVVLTALFAIEPAFGLPLVPRYLATPGVLGMVFYGAAVAGFARLPRGIERHVWMALGAGALALSFAFAGTLAGRLSALDTQVQAHGAVYAQLRTAARAPAVRHAFARCAPLSTAGHRTLPFWRWWLDGPPGSVGSVVHHARPLGRLLVKPRPSPRTTAFFGPPAHFFPWHARVPARYRTVYANRSFRLYAAPGCLRLTGPRA
jgi:hypothetical protein